MTVLLYRDATLSFPISEFAVHASRILKSVNVKPGREFVEVPGRVVGAASYKRLPTHFLAEAKSADLAIVATAKRYDNNFFYDSGETIVIVSFADWDSLTTVPLTNGLALFLAELLAEEVRLGKGHRIGQRGCLNDFRQLKTDIDFALRAAFICDACRKNFIAGKRSRTERAIRKELDVFLDEISDASRSNADMLDYWNSRSVLSASKTFDVFLCHNSSDKREVRMLSHRLKNKGIAPWVDEEQLRPGIRWQAVLEDQIATVKTAAVLVGSSGIGPWQDMEIHAILAEFVKRHCPVIPVLLRSCSTAPELPLFLRQLLWVDFRRKRPDPWRQLLWGVTGNQR